MRNAGSSGRSLVVWTSIQVKASCGRFIRLCLYAGARSTRHQQPLHCGVCTQLRGVVERVLPCLARWKLLGFPDPRGGSFFKMYSRKKDHLFPVLHRLILVVEAFTLKACRVSRRLPRRRRLRFSATRRLQRFYALRSWRHVTRSFKRLIRVGTEIRESRGLFCSHRSHLRRRVEIARKRSDCFGFDRIGLDLCFADVAAFGASQRQVINPRASRRYPLDRCGSFTSWTGTAR